jgi:hypothetical protein
MDTTNREFKNWEEFIECIRTMPLTWVPAALLVLVEEAINRKVFKNDGMLLKAIDEKIKWMDKETKNIRGNR